MITTRTLTVAACMGVLIGALYFPPSEALGGPEPDIIPAEPASQHLLNALAPCAYTDTVQMDDPDGNPRPCTGGGGNPTPTPTPSPICP